MRGFANGFLPKDSWILFSPNNQRVVGRYTGREFKLLRHPSDLLCLFGDNFPHQPIASGCTKGQLAVNVGQSNSQPVDFLLDDSLWAVNASVPGLHIIQAEQVVQGQQFEAMLGFLPKKVASSDMLRRGSRRYPLWVLSLNCFELLGQGVKFPICDFWPVIIVQMIVTLYFLNQSLIFV